MKKKTVRSQPLTSPGEQQHSQAEYVKQARAGIDVGRVADREKPIKDSSAMQQASWNRASIGHASIKLNTYQQKEPLHSQIAGDF
jgi:hypothetical protein